MRFAVVVWVPVPILNRKCFDPFGSEIVNLVFHLEFQVMENAQLTSNSTSLVQIGEIWANSDEIIQLVQTVACPDNKICLDRGAPHGHAESRRSLERMGF